MMMCVLVFIGGAVGALARFALAQIEGVLWAASEHPSDGRGTLAANLLASACCGAFYGLYNSSDNPEHFYLLVTGLCGGLSTYSTFTYELATIYKAGRASRAGFLATYSIAGGIVLFSLGSALFHS